MELRRTASRRPRSWYRNRTKPLKKYFFFCPPHLLQNNLVIDTPRVRKQTRHFSTLKDDDLVEFSDLESDDEDRPRSRRHDRHHHPLHHSYGRTDCFQVEKQLLVYGYVALGREEP